MTLDAEVIILGGGCAGLSLAVALAQYAPHLRVVTLEQREGYTRDRTWCFWNTTEHPFRVGVTQAGSQWRVRTNGKEARQQSPHLRYEHLPADRFYAIAQQRIEAAVGQQLLFGTEASPVSSDAAICEVETTRGRLRCRRVFDARTAELESFSPWLWQRLLGWHVRTDRPCFDPACVDLMDLQPCGNAGRTAFFYVLPFSAYEALVEITYLDPPSLQPEDGSAPLRERMRSLCGDDGYQILYQETGSLPMGEAPAPEPGPVFSIGTRGGRVKPSSGYAFQRIQRQSEARARALGRGDPLPQQPEPRVYPLLDRIFLSALRQQPQRIPGYFLELFRRVPPEALVPFLSETASSPALLATVLALPKRDFLRAGMSAGKGVPA